MGDLQSGSPKTMVSKHLSARQVLILQIHHVISDITGITGLRIIEAVLSGERDPAKTGRSPGWKDQSF